MRNAISAEAATPDADIGGVTRRKAWVRVHPVESRFPLGETGQRREDAGHDPYYERHGDREVQEYQPCQRAKQAERLIEDEERYQHRERRVGARGQGWQRGACS